ncbi:MAG TPA: biotin/lipoyl-containing protein, partial [Streptosporangiaceae bacterium]|nr:biotin/lipoyl-containing protein [Streptosporangiaceae bacterium]
MKMESILTAPQDGIVERLLVRAGDQVEAGAPLLLLAPPTPAPGTTDITDTVNTTDTTEAEDAA